MSRPNVFYDPYHSLVRDPFKDFQLGTTTATYVVPSGGTLGLVNAPTDWEDTREGFVFKASLPGFGREDLLVEIEDERVLKITGEKRVKREERHDRWLHRIEQSSEKFVRSYRLPESARVDQVKASFKDGVLTITVPRAKVEARRSRVRTVPLT